MYSNGTFHMYSDGEGLVIGVDFAEHEHDFSVTTVLQKDDNGIIHVLESAVIGRGVANREFKQRVLDNCELFIQGEKNRIFDIRHPPKD